jgi:hypothetical protein
LTFGNGKVKIMLLSSYGEDILDESPFVMPPGYCVFLLDALLPGLSFAADELEEIKISFAEKYV